MALGKHHRHFTHRSFQAATPVVAGNFRLDGGAGADVLLGGDPPPAPPVADTAGDAHSPYVQREKTFANRVVGFWHAHTGWLFDTEVTDWGRYIPDLIKDKAMFRVSESGCLVWGGRWGWRCRRRSAAWCTARGRGRFSGSCGAASCACLRAPQHVVHQLRLPHFRGSSVQDPGPCGEQLADCDRDQWRGVAQQSPRLSYACNHSMHWWQYDPNYWLISTLKALGLVWDIRNANPQEVQNKLAGIETAAPGAEAMDAASPSIRGVVKASREARRYQQTVAFLVVVVPLWWRWRPGRLGRPASALDLALLVAMYVLTIAGVTIGFHRHFAHRAFDAPRSALAASWARWRAGAAAVLEAMHRRHHIFSDQAGDPHSPNLVKPGPFRVLRGLWHSHIGWMFGDDITSWAHYSADHLRDPLTFRLNQTYFVWVALGLAVPAAVGGLATGTWAGAATGLLWGGLVRMFLANHISWCVGSVCHVFGARRFDNQDRSANNYLVALFSFGEGLQNNHHAFPNSANHRVYWWEPGSERHVDSVHEVAGDGAGREAPESRGR